MTEPSPTSTRDTDTRGWEDEIDLDEIENRAATATAGPWKVWAMDVLADPVGNSNIDDGLLVARTSDEHRGLRTFNADFIAAARSDVPALVAEVRRLRAENARLVRQQDATQVANIASRRSLCEQRDRYLAERDEAVAENERLRECIAAMDDDADHALTVRDEAVEAESLAGDRIVAERDALSAVIDKLRQWAFTEHFPGRPLIADVYPGLRELFIEAGSAAGLAAPVRSNGIGGAAMSFEAWQALYPAAARLAAGSASPVAAGTDRAGDIEFVSDAAREQFNAWAVCDASDEPCSCPPDGGHVPFPAVAAPVGETPDELRLHRIEWDSDREGAQFHCDGDNTSACHIYPSCECENWYEETLPDGTKGHPHLSVVQDECWMLPWLGASDAEDTYCGDDPMPRTSGPIVTEWEGDCVLWDYPEPVPALPVEEQQR